MMSNVVEDEVIAIIGGGIAGVSCAEHLALLSPHERIVVFSSSPLVKVATRIRKVAKVLEEFDIEEKPVDQFASAFSNVKVVQDVVEKVDAQDRILFTNHSGKFVYKKLCVCTGGIPKVIANGNPFVLGIRDLETVKDFEKKIGNARRIIIVGNGGIATELAYEIQSCQVVWAVKDRSIGATFFDAGAAEFFLPRLNLTKHSDNEAFVKRIRYYVEDGEDKLKAKVVGNALGPDWALGRNICGKAENTKDVHIEYNCEVAQMFTQEEFKASETNVAKSLQTFEGEHSTTESDELSWPVFVQLTNRKVFGCDFVVSATGVVPNVEQLGLNVELASDGGIKVNEYMQTSDSNIYAAGDACTADWKAADHWFQMRLWTQARQMGAYAAQCISNHLLNQQVIMDFCFEMFTHVTKFFGFKTILLGLYNAQRLGTDYELLLRMTKGVEYVKVVMREGRMQGAVLIGETDLEETFENLILNQFDLTNIQDDLLNPDVDIEDYFD